MLDLLERPPAELLGDGIDPEVERLIRRLWRRPPMPPIRGGDRQFLHGGPTVDPPVSAPLSANTSTSAVDMWTGAQFTPIFAYEPRIGRAYIVEAGGIMSWASTGTLTISPFYGTSSGVALGASTATTTPGTASSKAWFLRFVLVFRTIGAAGANSTCIGNGFLTTGTDGAADSSVIIPFGGTSASVDATLTKDITIQKTLSVAGSWTTDWVYGAWLN